MIYDVIKWAIPVNLFEMYVRLLETISAIVQYPLPWARVHHNYIDDEFLQRVDVTELKTTCIRVGLHSACPAASHLDASEIL